MPPPPEVVVVGAGVAGLACARALSRAGRPVLVLERAAGVGGRCATRRIDGHPVDFGAVFLHGRDPVFLGALDEAAPGAGPLEWPRSVRGSGRPCHPAAFDPRARRVAFAEGVTAFPTHLARGLEVRTGASVAALEAGPAALRLAVDGAPPVEAPTVVLALAAEQAVALLATFPGAPREIRSASALLSLSSSEAALALLASYPEGVPPPEWDVLYPEDSDVVQLVSNESSKRETRGAVVVWQAHARWSREHLDDPRWPDLLLAEGARLLGPWAARPRATDAHRWQHARTDRGAELASPMVLSLGRGLRVGLCGERFAPGGGVEAAFLSGARLAARLVGEPA